MAEVAIAEVVAFTIAGTITALFGGGRWVLLIGVLAPLAFALIAVAGSESEGSGPYSVDFPAQEVFAIAFLACLIPFPGWAAGVVAGTAVRGGWTRRIERRPIH